MRPFRIRLHPVLLQRQVETVAAVEDVKMALSQHQPMQPGAAVRDGAGLVHRALLGGADRWIHAADLDPVASRPRVFLERVVKARV